MVTLTLIQGVVNTFVIFFARVIAGVIDNATRVISTVVVWWARYFGIVIVLQVVFGISQVLSLCGSRVSRIQSRLRFSAAGKHDCRT